ncbi:hypothetical protein MPL3365_170087 [Mesorhizobium plurifarium]|uniref:Uncharacterized protein n=1 Tax=Mesorhizobium plurifarium TaxID=69974 RepID=A0A090G5G9_MESPL|nr:hypothetical protein MPL3365_170087 [Mesorhizobium plurifarium]
MRSDFLYCFLSLGIPGYAAHIVTVQVVEKKYSERRIDRQ